MSLSPGNSGDWEGKARWCGRGWKPGRTVIVRRRRRDAIEMGERGAASPDTEEFAVSQKSDNQWMSDDD